MLSRVVNVARRHCSRWGAALAMVGLALSTGVVGAVTTHHFTVDNAEILAAGELKGTVVHSEGFVTAGAETSRIPLPDVPVAFSLTRGPDDSVYVGTGNDGKIFRVVGEKALLYADTDQLLVSALAFG